MQGTNGERNPGECLTRLLGAINQDDYVGVCDAIKSGADVNAAFDKFSFTLRPRATPVVFSCVGRDVRILKALIEAGADVNARDWLGRTLLHEVVRTNGAKNKVSLLRLAGADWFAQDNQGRTPIEWAIHFSRGYLLSGDRKLAEEIQALLLGKHGTPASQSALEQE